MNEPNLIAKLFDIEDIDPRMGMMQPSEARMEEFRKWVIARYGQPVWDIYIKGGWAPGSEF